MVETECRDRGTRSLIGGGDGCSKSFLFSYVSSRFCVSGLQCKAGRYKYCWGKINTVMNVVDGGLYKISLKK